MRSQTGSTSPLVPVGALQGQIGTAVNATVDPKTGVQTTTTVDPKTGYLDQIAVAPEFWGSNVAQLLLDAGKRLSPARLDLLVNTDNARAIAFYETNGFEMAGHDVNSTSGRRGSKIAGPPAKS